MKLTDLSIDFIRTFASPEIFKRGFQYYKDGLVEDLKYQPDKDTIQAQIIGNYGDYDIGISGGKKGLDAECTCPYDGYPCKHIVAVLLTFLKDKQKYIGQVREQKQTRSTLERKLSALSRAQLEKIILTGVAKYPDFKRELMVILEPDKGTTLPTLLKQIDRAFPDIQSRSYSPRTIIKELQKIASSIEEAAPEMKIEVYWKIVHRIISELNAYGMQEAIFENEACKLMDMLIGFLENHENLKTKRQEIISGLMQEYLNQNCGIIDAIYSTAFSLCTEDSDYRILIEALERRNKANSFHSYTTQLLAQLYEIIGDVDSQVKVLGERLQYGLDYWQLAEFWLKKGEQQKVLEIVQEGIEKGTGRKTELYTFMLNYYQEHHDIGKIYLLLHQKIDRKEFGQYDPIETDPIYQFLWDYYVKEHNYGQIKVLLELCFSQGHINLELYQTAEKYLEAEDWHHFESKIRQFLNSKIQVESQKFGSWNIPVGTQEREILAGIYAYKNDKENLLETIKNSGQLLKIYEITLVDDYPLVYLQKYQEIVEKLIDHRGRENYQLAAYYARSIKEIYISKLQKPEAWKKYIADILMGNKKLKALQEEFTNL